MIDSEKELSNFRKILRTQKDAIMKRNLEKRIGKDEDTDKNSS